MVRLLGGATGIAIAVLAFDGAALAQLDGYGAAIAAASLLSFLGALSVWRRERS